MARRVFFSFHYDDVARAMVVRNSNIVRAESESLGFVDKADFEAVERRGQKAVTDWIDRQLGGTSVTVVLIGAETWSRRYVQYEIAESYKRGNGLLGIRIHNISEFGRGSSTAGASPFSYTKVPGQSLFSGEVSLPVRPPIYDWVNDDGRANIGRWIESVAPTKTGLWS